MVRSLITAVAIALGLSAAFPCFAGRVVLSDQGDQYADFGQRWPVLGAIEPLVGSIPFALDFGTGAVSNRTFFVNPRGRLDFTTDITAATNTGDFVNILYNFPKQPPPAPLEPPFAPRENITHDLGLVDPSLIDSTVTPHFDDDSFGLKVYRIFFNLVCPTDDPSCNPLQFEANFVYLTDETFVLQFSYGTNFFDSLDPVTEFTNGFQIGSNARSFTANTIEGPDFCFDHGVASDFTTIARCGGTTTTTVPEPDVRSLMLFGGVALALGTLARRRSRVRCAAL